MTNRRDFLMSTVYLTLAGKLMLLSQACADDPDPFVPEFEPEACNEVTITANHGHVLVVPIEDVEAAVAKTYNIQGDSPHEHVVALTATDFNSLAAGNEVTVTSTEGAAHSHSVTVRCA